MPYFEESTFREWRHELLSILTGGSRDPDWIDAAIDGRCARPAVASADVGESTCRKWRHGLLSVLTGGRRGPDGIGPAINGRSAGPAVAGAHVGREDLPEVAVNRSRPALVW